MSTLGPTDWNDAMLTGVEEIDQQHRVLVNTLNDFAAKLAGHADDRLFDQVTRDLLAYAIYHFETEEELIKRYGYDLAERDEANAHIRQHRSFSAQVIALRGEAGEARSAAQYELLAFLKDWLMNHIGTSDQRLGKFLRAHSSHPLGQ